MLTDLKRPTIVGTAIRSTVAAVVAVTVVFSIAKASGDDLIVGPEFGSGEPKELKLWVALIATVIVGGFLGSALAWLTQRFTRQPRVAFLIVGALGLIGYGILAAVRSEATSTALWLNAMHLAAAIPIVGALAYALNPQRQGKL